jgi:hypothetical protein
MVRVPVTCPYGHSDQVLHGGHTETGPQRSRGQQTTCAHRSFVLEPADNGRLPQVKDHMSAMALNGRGLRETTRVWKISPTPVMNAWQKKRHRCAGSPSLCALGWSRMRWRSSCGSLRQRQGTHCGHWCSGKKPRAGGGMRSITAVARCWPTCWGVARTRCW